MPLETNIYPITNLAELATDYRLYRARGLSFDDPEYNQNREALQARLSRTLRAPVVAIRRSDGDYIAIPADGPPIPADMTLVRTIVTLEPLPDTFRLDLTKRDPETDVIALRFLRFFFQSPLRRVRSLWQPEAGHAFYERQPHRSHLGVDQFLGYTIRPVITADDGIGLCVDVTARYVSSRPLPAKLNRDEFNRRVKGRNFVYHFGDDWYEIHVEGLGDGSLLDHKFVADGRRWNLLEYVQTKARKPVAQEVAQLAGDSSFVMYRDRRGNNLAAPSALSYEVLSTRRERVAKQHGRTLLPPHTRRAMVQAFVDRHLRRLVFGSKTIHVGNKPFVAPENRLLPPDLLFGNDRTLSVRGTPGAEKTALRDLGARRLSLLRDSRAGFFVQGPLDRQYLLLPQSVYDSYGSAFRGDLIRAVGEFATNVGSYAPIVIAYDDTGRRSFVAQGNAILAAAAAMQDKPGYALVMLHRLNETDGREDQLAAMVSYELFHRFDVRAAVIHSEMASRAYVERVTTDGVRVYERLGRETGRFAGYLRNVALNHVMLTNHRWPFVLAAPLNADVIVGIDVKCNTSGVISISRDGRSIHWLHESSRQKEQLARPQMQQYLERALRDEAGRRLMNPIRRVVLHRDGRTWPEELHGAESAVATLRMEGVLAPDASLTVIEISKTAPAPLRLFDVGQRNGRDWVENPEIGTIFYLGTEDAYLCSTGRSFPRDGTVHPLHVRRVAGPMSLQDCISDLFALTILTWTRPEDCSRVPITTRLNDRFLVSEARTYDDDALAWGAEESA